MVTSGVWYDAICLLSVPVCFRHCIQRHFCRVCYLCQLVICAPVICCCEANLPDQASMMHMCQQCPGTPVFVHASSKRQVISMTQCSTMFVAHSTDMHIIAHSSSNNLMHPRTHCVVTLAWFSPFQRHQIPGCIAGLNLPG